MDICRKFQIYNAPSARQSLGLKIPGACWRLSLVTGMPLYAESELVDAHNTFYLIARNRYQAIIYRPALIVITQ